MFQIFQITYMYVAMAKTTPQCQLHGQDKHHLLDEIFFWAELKLTFGFLQAVHLLFFRMNLLIFVYTKKEGINLSKDCVNVCYIRKSMLSIIKLIVCEHFGASFVYIFLERGCIVFIWFTWKSAPTSSTSKFMDY